MNAYIIRRLLLAILTLVIVTMLTVIAIRLVPGDIIDAMIVEMEQTGQQADAEELRPILERRLGLDVPIYIYYMRWVGDLILHGDLGTSLRRNIPVTQELLARLPVTFELGVLAMMVALLIAFPVGIYAAIRQDTIGDYIARSFAILCISLPGFWVGTMVVVFPSIWWGWAPPIVNIPFFEDPIGNLKMYLLPAVILGMSLTGVTMRMTRTMMLEVLRQDYIRTAWSKGLKEGVVVMRHALKNALIPIVTIIGMQAPILVGGAVITEQIFCLPGMGRLIVRAAFERDYTMIIGTTLFLSVTTLIIILITDLSYGYLEPRIRYK